MELKDIKSHGYLFFAEENGRLVAEDEGGKPYFPDRKTDIHAGLVEVWEIKDKGNYAFVTGENVKTSRIPSADEIARTAYENNLDIASEAVSFDGWPVFSLKSETTNAFICFEGKIMRIGSIIRKGYKRMNYILSIFDADRSKNYGILEACNRLAVNYAQELNTDDIIPDLVPKIMINPDVCSCCGEIRNRENLRNIPLGKHNLHLCSDCYAEYIKRFKESLTIPIPESTTNRAVAQSVFGIYVAYAMEQDAIRNGSNPEWWDEQYEK